MLVLVRVYFLWEELVVVLVGGRLYALAHGVRQKVAHLGVAAGAAVWGVDVVYLILEWCCVAPLAVVPGRAAPF